MWAKIMASSLYPRIMGVKFSQGFNCKYIIQFTYQFLIHIWIYKKKEFQTIRSIRPLKTNIKWFRSIHNPKLSIKVTIQILTLIRHFLTIRNWVKQEWTKFWKPQGLQIVTFVALPQMFASVRKIKEKNTVLVYLVMYRVLDTWILGFGSALNNWG